MMSLNDIGVNGFSILEGRVIRFRVWYVLESKSWGYDFYNVVGF